MYHSMYFPTLRYGVAGPFAVAITFFLFFLMQYLINNTGEDKLDESETIYFLEFVRLIEEPEDIVKTDEDNDLKRVEPPIIPAADKWDDVDYDSSYYVTAPPPDSFDPSDKSILTPSLNAELIAVVDMQPIYPQRAIFRNIEGYVIVEFTVTESGSTEAIRIIEAEPDKIFNKSAIKATARSRYRPRIVDGKPVEVTGMRKMFSFELKD